MKYTSVRQLFLLVLGALVALGIGMAAVQAQGMAPQMAGMAAQMSTTGMACEHCQADRGMSMPCVTVCVAPSFALAATPDLVFTGVSTGRLLLPKTALLFGIGLKPPHSPPRTTYIG